MTDMEQRLAEVLQRLLALNHTQGVTDEQYEAAEADADEVLTEYDAAQLPLHVPGANPPIPSPERIAACVRACDGIPTEDLKNLEFVQRFFAEHRRS